MRQRAGRVIAIMAHPDDIELLCAGTLRLLVERGWELRCVTLSGGDLGSPTGTREEIREIRLREAAAAADVLGGDYVWAGLDDLSIRYCPEQLRAVTRIIRDFAPDLVFTHSPACYMVDHEETARLVRTGCFAAGIRLFAAGAPPTTNGVPALYYADAVDRKDSFGREVRAELYVDVTSVFPVRQAALACHASQREWLRIHHGMDDYLDASDASARAGGQQCGVLHAEGFRQHLGHGYPQRDVLTETLGEAVRRPAHRFDTPTPGEGRHA